ncbi:M1 family metallopeptidase [Nocardioides sp. SYSU DS0663]|uniref:M1 family metallopeptidase n=1 Tax=Nocardioides sp. SYSU DS0663 TaxID=3416445 RepID=UPI003F4C555C
MNRGAGPLALLVGLALAGCSGGSGEAQPREAAPSSSTSSAAPERSPGTTRPADALDAALSEPREDSVYPHVGDPGVDALHYDLALDWDPAARVLEGRERLVFRSTEDDDQVQLDLAPELQVRSVRVDGEPVRFGHRGKDLVVRHDVVADERYRLVLTYTGTPQPVTSPTTRTDVSETGWTTTTGGEVWTMQEPYGAFTWYAANDHPSDKALYDITVSVPSPWVGVANGELLSRRDAGDRTVTHWRLAEPAASYLVTVAIGDYVVTREESATGVPISYWVPRGRPELVTRLRATARELPWLEERLGRYPYDTLGVVVVDSSSAMETQTMITVGTTDYATSAPVLVHEMAHHWYGDLVTPTDWRDLWLNEGMVMYLQLVWQAQHDDVPLEALLGGYAEREAAERADHGPPGDYDPDAFGESNVYYGPALMWHELRERLGDEVFWSLVREWPASQADGSADREEHVAWVEEHTGEELSAFFDAWLLDETTPPRS